MHTKLLGIPGGSLASLLFLLASSRAANTWDGGGADGNWSTPLNWDNDTLPDFPAGVAFAPSANLITNNDLIGLTVGGITFVAPAEAFTLGGNAITLSGAINQNSTGGPQTITLPMTLSGPQAVNVIEDASLTIGAGANGSGVISGAGSLTKAGPGNLILGAPHTYTGDTVLDGGTVFYTANNTATNLVFGAAAVPPFSTVTTGLYLTDAGLTASSLALRTNNTGANPVTIDTGRTLTINGAVSVGPNTSGQAAGGGVTTRLDATGAGSLVVTGTGHFSVALPRLNGDAGGADPFSTVNLTGLSSFTVNTTGELRVGGGNARGILNLASGSNTINVASVRVGDSNVTSGAGGNNNGGTSTLSLGLGTNDITANSLIIGAVKSHGIFNFQSNGGSVTIAGRAGGTANITVGNASSATASTNTSQFLLAGHSATIQAGTVIIGQLAGATANQGAGNVTFGTGTFNIANLQMAVHSTGTAPGGTTGTFTIGNDPGDSATGVLNITNQFLLVNRTSTAGTIANSNFTIYGGTVNVGSDILIVDSSPTAARTTTFTLAGGTLNMNGHAIASAALPVNTVTISGPGTTATLANLGGTGINGAGVYVNGGGTLVLEGTNTYTGGTVIASGRVEVGTGGLTGTLPAGDVTNNGILVFNRAGAVTAGNAITGTGRVEQIGSGTLTLSGASTFTEPVEIDAGTLVVTGSISSDVKLRAGTLAGAGDSVATGKAGHVTMEPGSKLQPGTTGLPGDAGTLTLAGLTVNGGDLQFDPGAAGDLVNVTGTATFAGASTITPNPAAPEGSHTVLTAGTLTLGTPPVVVAPANGRKTFTADYTTPNTIKLVVAGSSKALTWTGIVNGTWDAGAAGTLNWSDGATGERFFSADAVTFGNGPANRNISIAAAGVLPASVTVNNIVGNDYTLSGGPIGGGSTLTKSGAGKLTLSSANTYSGGTTLNAGTLNINHAAAPGGGMLTINDSSTLNNTSGSPITLAGNNAQTWNGSFAFTGTNNLNLGVGEVTMTAAPAITVDAGTLTVGGAIRGIDGNVGITKIGAGTLVLAGANTYGGNTHVGMGTLAINSPNAIGTGIFSIAGGTIDNTSGADVTLVTNNELSLQSNVIFTGTNSLNLGTGPVLLSTSPAIQVGANTLTVGGVIANGIGNSITKTGAGTLVLAGANTYTGTTSIDAGTLRVTNNASVGDPAGAVHIAPGGALDLAGSPAANNLNFGFKRFNIAGTGAGGTGALTNSGATGQQNAFQHVTLTADAAVGGTGRFDIRSAPTTALNSDLDLAGHTLTKTGANQFSLVGTSVSDGNIVVNQGVFSIETVTAIPDLGSGRTITFNAGTTFQVFSNTISPSAVTRPMVFNGPGIQVGSASNNSNSFVGSPMTLNGDVTFTSLNNTNNTSTLTLTGNIAEQGGPRAVTKTGPGTLVLSGTNAWTGPTSVNAGTLLMNGNLTGAGAVTVSAAGTLGGSGSLAGSVTVNGTLAPGAPLSRLTVGGSVAFAGGSNLRVDIGGTAAGEFDALTAGGQITAAGTLTVTLVNGFTPVPGAVFDILDFASLTGTFTAIVLPPLAAGQSWDTGKLYTEGKLAVSGSLATYAEWQAAYGAGAFNADDDLDGVANGILYVLGVRPGAGNASAALPRPGIADNRLQVQFQLPEPGPTDVTLRIAASETLAIAGSWTTIATKDGANAWTGPATVTTGAVENGKVTVTVTDINLLTSGPRRFLRLSAELH